MVEDRSVYLEEFARTQIAQEEMHGLEVRKMLRDVSVMQAEVEEHHARAEDEREDDEDRKDKKKKDKKKDKKKKDKEREAVAGEEEEGD